MRPTFNTSLTPRDKVTRQYPQTTATEEKRAKAESNQGPAYQPNVLPLGQTLKKKLACYTIWMFSMCRIYNFWTCDTEYINI